MIRYPFARTSIIIHRYHPAVAQTESQQPRRRRAIRWKGSSHHDSLESGGAATASAPPESPEAERELDLLQARLTLCEMLNANRSKIADRFAQLHSFRPLPRQLSVLLGALGDRVWADPWSEEPLLPDQVAKEVREALLAAMRMPHGWTPGRRLSKWEQWHGDWYVTAVAKFCVDCLVRACAEGIVRAIAGDAYIA
ncbi:hypothetical protein LTR36_008915 [Oleoguttula mirabilis]|uniref:Uncharacterized protein n=1 Tax=Oleoguttula mirabilis TaxID=1507867 RepID=A0AAV9J7I6_9PEZI|nr:hypothetical protein LTR36_008915 [Oleoguttula mirabilis]